MVLGIPWTPLETGRTPSAQAHGGKQSVAGAMVTAATQKHTQPQAAWTVSDSQSDSCYVLPNAGPILGGSRRLT